MDEASSLTLLLQNVVLSVGGEDVRQWNIHSGGVFTCNSYFSYLSSDSSIPDDAGFRFIWKSKVPPKVKILSWTIAHGRVSTADVLQKKRPNLFISPSMCVLCRNDEETMDHLFLHCKVARVLWSNLFSVGGLNWVAPRKAVSLLHITFKGLGGSKRGKCLWNCAILATWWVLWIERNARIFDDRFGGVADMWERISFLASLWASVAPVFRGVPFWAIHHNWVAVTR